MSGTKTLATDLRTLQVAQSKDSHPPQLPPPNVAWETEDWGALGHQHHLLVGGGKNRNKDAWLLTGMGVPLSEGGTMSGERT